MKAILLYLWQLPQNLLGLLMVFIMKPEISHGYHGRRFYYSTRMKGGISLGRYLIIETNLETFFARKALHEYGHSRQSALLGPLYLAVVGLPSLLWAFFWTPSSKYGYYDFYTEAWADKLGGVHRC